MTKILLISCLIVAAVSNSFIAIPGFTQPSNAHINTEDVVRIIRMHLGQPSQHDTMNDIRRIANFFRGQLQGHKENIVVFLTESIQPSLSSLPLADYETGNMESLAKVSQSINQFANTTLSKLVTFVDCRGKDAEQVESLIRMEGFNMQSILRLVIAAPAAAHQRTLSQLTRKPRLLQQTSDGTYLIKFVFSVVFIIVTAAVLISIADMRNTRDTLLYAKFIADVNN